ncbi:histamine H2 receptor-like [Pocillopora verrucosa]|uniref:histamine H2 receptor-like n=1 Tax=Pocillopora verrucosa TaxID=203993 RepID=UPI003341704C
METWFSILGWSLSILTITGNGFIICLVSRRRRLRKTNAFIVSLAAADFCVGLSTFPPLFVCEEIIGCNPKAFLASGMDYLRWLFGYTSVTNLCGLVLERYVAVVKPLSYLTFMTRKRVLQMFVISWTIPVILVLAFLLNGLVFKEILLFKVLTLITIVFLEFLPCSGLIFCFASMYYIVYKHERAARILAKQLRYNQRFLLRIKEKAAVKIMAIVIGLFLVTYSFALRCSFIYILNDDEKPCDGQEYKIPLLVLNSVVNPFAYAVFKRDINMEMTQYICCVVCKKRNRTEPIDENNSFILRSCNA